MSSFGRLLKQNWGTIQKKRTFLNNTRIIWKYLSSYLLVLIIPFCFGVFIYLETIRIAEHESKMSMRSALLQTHQILDERWTELRTVSFDIADNVRTRHFQHLTRDIVNSNPFVIFTMRDSLKAYNVSNNFIDQYFVFFSRNNYAFTHDTVYMNDQLYSSHFSSNENTYFEWLNIFQKTYYKGELIRIPFSRQFSAASLEDHLAYVTSIGPVDQPLGAIIIILKTSEIQAILSSALGGAAGYAAILGSESMPVVFVEVNSQDKDDFIQEEDVVVETIDSDVIDLEYFLSRDRIEILAPAYRVRRRIILVLVYLFICGLIIAFIMSYVNSKTLRKLTLLLPENQRGNFYKAIVSNVEALFDRQKKLVEQIEEHRPILQNAFLSRILRGGFHSERDARVFLSHAGITIDGSWFLPGIASVIQQEATQITREILEERDLCLTLLQGEVKKRLTPFVYRTDDEQIGFLVSFNRIGWNELRVELECNVQEIIDLLKKEYSLPVVVVCGYGKQSLTTCSGEYEKAVVFCENLMLERRSGFFWSHDNVSFQSTGYYFPLELEQRLMTLVKAGATYEVRAVFEEIIDANCYKRTLTTASVTLLIHQLLGTLARIIQHTPVPLQIPFVRLEEMMSDHKGEPVGCIRQIMGEFILISNLAYSRKRSRNDELREKMQRHIDDHITDHDLTLTNVACHCEVSDVYASQFFHEQTGTTFSSYLEHARMKFASEALIAGGRSVKDVAYSAGYRNLNSFSRAFKRVFGVSPSRYRS